MSNELNENETSNCPHAQIVGEVLSTLSGLGRIDATTAFVTLEKLTATSEHSLCSTETIVAEVMIEALENLWVDPDEAIAITAKLAGCTDASALQLLV